MPCFRERSFRAKSKATIQSSEVDVIEIFFASLETKPIRYKKKLSTSSPNDSDRDKEYLQKAHNP